MEPKRPLMTVWRHVACWISKATRAQAYAHASAPTTTHQHALTLACTLAHPQNIAFPWQQWLVDAPECYIIRTLPVLL
jgi:hypothetical protein